MNTHFRKIHNEGGDWLLGNLMTRMSIVSKKVQENFKMWIAFQSMNIFYLQKTKLLFKNESKYLMDAQFNFKPTSFIAKFSVVFTLVDWQTNSSHHNVCYFMSANLWLTIQLCVCVFVIKDCLEFKTPPMPRTAPTKLEPFVWHKTKINNQVWLKFYVRSWNSLQNDR